MSGGIFVIRDDDQLIEMIEQKYDSENILQELLEKYPNLLAGDQINSESPRRWLLISRELKVPNSEEGYGRFSLDHLFLDQDSIPTLVEVKRSSDTRIRREVVGQMLDYASNAVAYWPLETIRSKFEETCERDNKVPSEIIDEFLGSNFDQDLFWQSVKDNLAIGKIRIVFVADEIPPELKRIVEFLNEQMDPAEVLAIEIRQYKGEGLRTLVPRVTGQTQAAIGKKQRSTGIKWNESLFFEVLDKKGDTVASEVALQILDWAKKSSNRIWWGSGKKIGSFVPIIHHNGRDHQLFAVYTYGTVEIYFQWYAAKPPFDDIIKRRELLEKLNYIEGVQISGELITKRPNIPLNVFSNDEKLKDFTGVYEWFIKTVQDY